MKKSYIIFLIIGAGILLTAGYFLGRQTDSSTALLADQNTTAPTIDTQATLNKIFSFPVIDSNGQKVTDITYAITTVDKQDQVIIKGQRASAVEGRTFFIVNIKLTNTSPKTIQLNSRDYIRITTGKSTELFAADLYNDPIIVQPISTEYTKLGFPIDKNETHIVLHIGELNGSKTDVPVTFSK